MGKHDDAIKHASEQATIIRRRLERLEHSAGLQLNGLSDDQFLLQKNALTEALNLQLSRIETWQAAG